MNGAPTLLVAFLLCMTCCPSFADTFGSGANEFSIEFVNIGNPNNADDTTGKPNPAGKVEYAYRMGKFEISEEMVDKANAEGGLGLTHTGRGADKPATQITWFEAATFVNWLNTDSGGSPAYKFSGSTFEVWLPSDTADYDASNIYRSKRAKYFLPSMDEWYKAAYHDKSAGTAGTYFDYPTGSNSAPDGIDFAGDTTFDAVFNDDGIGGVVIVTPKDITDVGVLSPYGTAGQGGNVWEWEETDFDLLNSARGLRGGGWIYDSFHLRSSSRGSGNPTSESIDFGFRVASIPEPSTVLLGTLAGLGMLTRRRGRS